MTDVTIARRTERFSRTPNGAWSRHVVIETETLVRPESWLCAGISLCAGITVTWPDGVTEHAFPGNRGVGCYPPEIIPADGRLAALLRPAD